MLCGIEAMKGTNTPDKVKYIEKIIKENNVIKYFLDENSDTYPLWKCATSRKPYQPRMFNVKKTHYAK